MVKTAGDVARMVQYDFDRLERLLKANPLPCSTGHRIASPGEFMWMYIHETMGVGFKHCDSRRYVYVQKRCGVDILTVSVNDMFDVIEFNIDE